MATMNRLMNLPDGGATGAGAPLAYLQSYFDLNLFVSDRGTGGVFDLEVSNDKVSWEKVLIGINTVGNTAVPVVGWQYYRLNKTAGTDTAEVYLSGRSE